MQKKSVAKDVFTIVLTIIAVIIIIVTIIGANYIFKFNFDKVIYKINPTDENLVKLSVSLIEKDDTDEMNEYLTKAAEVEDLYEIIYENEYFIEIKSEGFFSSDTSYSNSETAASDTYERINIYSALSYVFIEDYDEFEKRFKEINNSLTSKDNIESNGIMTLVQVLIAENRITDKGYMIMLDNIDDTIGEVPELIPENEKIITIYARELMLKQQIYHQLRDGENAKKTNDEMLKVLNSLRELEGDDDEN